MQLHTGGNVSADRLVSVKESLPSYAVGTTGPRTCDCYICGRPRDDQACCECNSVNSQLNHLVAQPCGSCGHVKNHCQSLPATSLLLSSEVFSTPGSVEHTSRSLRSQQYQHGWLTSLGLRCRSNNTKHLERSLRYQQSLVSHPASQSAGSTTVVSTGLCFGDSNRYICLHRQKQLQKRAHTSNLLVNRSSLGTSLDDEDSPTHFFLPAVSSVATKIVERKVVNTRLSCVSLPEKAAKSGGASVSSGSDCCSSVQVSPVSTSSAVSGLLRLLKRETLLHCSSSLVSRRQPLLRRRKLINWRCSSLERNHHLNSCQTPQTDTTASTSVQLVEHHNWYTILDPVMARVGHVKLTESSDSTSNCVSSGDGGGAPISQLNSVINRPARDWLHDDAQLKTGGVSYDVTYVGRLEVRESMKALSFEMRSLVAKECISRVCRKAYGNDSATSSWPTQQLAEGCAFCGSPELASAGSTTDTASDTMAGVGLPVTLLISSDQLTLRRRTDDLVGNDPVVAQHDMPNVSFASGSDPFSKEYVAYVTKDSGSRRLCYVLQCHNSAQQVISTIGQAFELRYRHFLERTAAVSATLTDPTTPTCSLNSRVSSIGECVYYNDLPGKVPPDLPPIPAPDPPTVVTLSSVSSRSLPPPLKIVSTVVPLVATGGNLIDLSTPSPTSNTRQHEYINTTLSLPTTATVAANAENGSTVDPFDMQPFGSCLPCAEDAVCPSSSAPTSATAPASSNIHLHRHLVGAEKCATVVIDNKQQLLGQPWFHGVTSRQFAESLLTCDGDFLVRESRATAGQFVLSGQQGGVRKHLLLVDPSGVVRTRDRTFDSVVHLIQYHRQYQLPIISAETALTLRNPVIKH